jgi:hypothetical protein
MSNYWAIAVGINHYQRLQPLHFAQQDAQSLCEILVSDAGFLPEHCLLLTDTSPELSGQSTDPNRENLLHWFQSLPNKLEAGDWVWCFFSGYGVTVNGEDYLLPINGDPDKPKETGIPARSLFDFLNVLPTDHILVLLDINRAQSSSNEKIGTEIAKLSAEYEIPTILSCQPDQFSYEAPDLNHGLFTQALVEGLRSHQCSQLSGLEEFLKTRLPELCDHTDRPVQDPVFIVINPSQLQWVIMPVNWAETETWIPDIESNPFAVEGDFYLGSFEAERFTFDDYESVEPQPVMMAATAVETPDPFRLEPDFVTRPSEDPIPPREERRPEPVSVAPNAVALGTNRNSEGIAQQSKGSEQMLWERLLFGGSAILLVLLLGVVFRNWSAFMGSPKPTSTSDAAPSQIVQNAPPTEPTLPPSPAAKKPGASVTVQPSSVATIPKTGQQLLNEARSFIKPSTATEASQAIQRALLIPKDDPFYAQAQQDIDRWSRNILEIARKRAEQRQFKQAIAAAQYVPRERPVLHAEAQKAMRQWRSRIR